MPRTQDLKAENTRLQARVAELEASLAAKPLVDRNSLVRMAISAPVGVLVINAQNGLELANPAAQRWLVRRTLIVGETWPEAIVPSLFAVLTDPLRRALAGHDYEADHVLNDRSGDKRTVRMQVLPRGDGADRVTGAFVALYDITETRDLDRAVRENEARLGRISEVTPSVNYIFDLERGVPVWFSGRTHEVYGHSAEELIRGGTALSRDLIHPDDLPKINAHLVKLAALPPGEVIEIELRIRRSDGTYRWILDRVVAFETAPDGRVLKSLSAALDIDERKRAEERRIMLINELNHRVKNTLAAVQSIARQTLRPDRPVAETLELFNIRLVALSAAHDVLTRENWEGAALKEIVAGAVGPFAIQGGDRITVSGPDVWLGPRAALALAMALHELAINAAKYGALSGESGRVDLTWDTKDAGDGPHVNLEWRERDGPPISPSRRAGFGSRLITQGLQADLDGAAELIFAPDGVVCRITTSLEQPPQLNLA